MAQTHPHLELEREVPVTERRSVGRFRPSSPPEDPRQHGDFLRRRLHDFRNKTIDDSGGYDERLLIKIKLEQKVAPEDINRAFAGIEIVSQEEDTLVLVFATTEKLDEFEAKLAHLAEGQQVTYANIVHALTDLDHWTRQDRTGWALERNGFPEKSTFLIDVELWPVGQESDASRMRIAFEEWVHANSGLVIDAVRQPHLTIYRVRCDLETAEKLLQHRDVRTVDLPAQIGLEQTLAYTPIQHLGEVVNPPDNATGVVVLDSGLATGHPVLAPSVGDAQSFLPGETADDGHSHGTAVAGIALYDDIANCLEQQRFIPEIRLFSGRVLDEQNEGNPTLIENQVERAVRYFVREYGCKVFNLSYGDINKPYNGRHVAGLAVTLDVLSRQFGILFVVSTGNYDPYERLNGDLRERYPDFLTSDSASILDPAPALNVLTVGSIARYDRNERWPNDPAYQPIARAGQPSPFTRCGPSINGAIKPDLVDYGGNWLVDARTGSQLMVGSGGAGELSTSSDFATGSPFKENFGTSFAAPRIANAAARIFNELPEASVDLCRALLVAHARSPKSCANLIPRGDDRLRHLIGYGLLDRSALFRSLEDCVTLWSEESIQNDSHHFYEIPIPDEFWHGSRRTREVTVALAHRPPVRTTRIDYKAISLSFKLIRAESMSQVLQWFSADGDTNSENRISEHNSNRRFGETTRSYGTVQADTWSFRSAPRRSDTWYVVVTRRDLPWGQQLSNERETYALAITLSDREAFQLQLTPSLYTQVEERLRARVRARAV